MKNLRISMYNNNHSADSHDKADYNTHSGLKTITINGRPIYAKNTTHAMKLLNECNVLFPIATNSNGTIFIVEHSNDIVETFETHNNTTNISQMLSDSSIAFYLIDQSTLVLKTNTDTTIFLRTNAQYPFFL